MGQRQLTRIVLTQDHSPDEQAGHHPEQPEQPLSHRVGGVRDEHPPSKSTLSLPDLGVCGAGGGDSKTGVTWSIVIRVSGM